MLSYENIALIISHTFTTFPVLFYHPLNKETLLSFTKRKKNLEIIAQLI